MTDQPRLLSKQEAAAYLGVGLSTFYAWVKAGHIHPGVFGSKQWDKRALDAAIDKTSGLDVAEERPQESALQKFLREAGCG